MGIIPSGIGQAKPLDNFGFQEEVKRGLCASGTGDVLVPQRYAFERLNGDCLGQS